MTPSHPVPARDRRETKIEPTFLLNCRAAVRTMRRAGINETLIATIVQDIRSATLNEEYRRLNELLRHHPPAHHCFGDMQDAIAEWCRDEDIPRPASPARTEEE